MKLYIKILLTVVCIVLVAAAGVLILYKVGGTLAGQDALASAGSTEMIVYYVTGAVVLAYCIYVIWRAHGEKRAPDTRRIVICALLTAMGVILGGYLSIPALVVGTYSVKIGFGVLPVILAGVLYGPLYGGMVGGVTDFLQAVLTPKGAYIPWFTVVGVLFGLIPGLFFVRKKEYNFPRILLAVACGQLISSVLLNTHLLVVLYENLSWEVLFVPRLINQCVMIPLYSGIIYYLLKALKKAKVI